MFIFLKKIFYNGITDWLNVSCLMEAKEEERIDKGVHKCHVESYLKFPLHFTYGILYSIIC
jgi:hypothetical protein